ncbi:carotenoid oxygenase family protein [Mycobacterium asiaticum]|uniref:Dioxygenase n=1 Tax=Mycobacterium asiaticum TaxID=1790 RepID=A0A1A3C2N9_MYCAS|nr:carotenoid oxygenase family protein [Mycobacterium asiaticum]OBI80587.1 carotenoid oxygenase [Mycobacterium asiaticum]
MVSRSPLQSRAGADLTGLPDLGRYLASLPDKERDRATACLGALGDADLASLGVSEAQPVEHDYPVDDIDGCIPADLEGTLYRNGPGRWQDHSGRPLHHLFDGDGMLSAFSVADGSVHYRNKYVRTRHYLGKTGLRHLGTAAPGGIKANIGRLVPNLANTNVVEHAGRLYALWEGGPPHEIDPVTLETIGVRRFGGELRWVGSYSAHPSTCPQSGDMFNFGVEFIPRPHLRIYRTDPTGKLKHFRSAPLPYVTMVHDFALTPSHLVFVVSPIIPDAVPVALGLKSLGDGLRYRPDRGSVFILVPRDGGKIRTVEYGAVMVFHLSNAYDDGGDTVIDAITYRDGRLLKRISRFHTSILDDAPSVFMRYRITRSGRVLGEALSDLPCEFPRHHAAYEGRKYRYAYINTRRHLAAFYDSITRIDLSDSSESTYTTPEAGNSFCEPVFTPKPNAASEDEGWVLSVEYQARTHTSRLVIFDAADIAGGPIASAGLRHHIPQGFHGNFVARSR